MDGSLIAIGAGLAIGISACGSALGQAFVGAKSVESIARQPEATGDIKFIVILAFAFLESLTIYGLLIAFLLVTKIG